MEKLSLTVSCTFLCLLFTVCYGNFTTSSDHTRSQESKPEVTKTSTSPHPQNTSHAHSTAGVIHSASTTKLQDRTEAQQGVRSSTDGKYAPEKHTSTNESLQMPQTTGSITSPQLGLSERNTTTSAETTPLNNLRTSSSPRGNTLSTAAFTSSVGKTTGQKFVSSEMSTPKRTEQTSKAKVTFHPTTVKPTETTRENVTSAATPAQKGIEDHPSLPISNSSSPPTEQASTAYTTTSLTYTTKDHTNITAVLSTTKSAQTTERTTITPAPPTTTAPKQRTTKQETSASTTTAPSTTTTAKVSTLGTSTTAKETIETTHTTPANTEKSQGAGKIVTIIISGALISMLIVILCILLRKRLQQNRRVENPEWAGPSPFLDGKYTDNLSTVDEEEKKPSLRSSKGISLGGFLPQRFSKRLSLLRETDKELMMGDFQQGSTFNTGEPPKSQKGGAVETDNKQNSPASSNGHSGASSKESPQDGIMTKATGVNSSLGDQTSASPEHATLPTAENQAAAPLVDIDLGANPTDNEALPPPSQLDEQTIPAAVPDTQPDSIPDLPPPPSMDNQSIPPPPSPPPLTQ